MLELSDSLTQRTVIVQGEQQLYFENYLEEWTRWFIYT